MPFFTGAHGFITNGDNSKNKPSANPEEEAARAIQKASQAVEVATKAIGRDLLPSTMFGTPQALSMEARQGSKYVTTGSGSTTFNGFISPMFEEEAKDLDMQLTDMRAQLKDRKERKAKRAEEAKNGGRWPGVPVESPQGKAGLGGLPLTGPHLGMVPPPGALPPDFNPLMLPDLRTAGMKLPLPPQMLNVPMEQGLPPFVPPVPLDPSGVPQFAFPPQESGKTPLPPFAPMPTQNNSGITFDPPQISSVPFDQHSPAAVGSTNPAALLGGNMGVPTQSHEAGAQKVGVKISVRDPITPVPPPSAEEPQDEAPNRFANGEQPINTTSLEDHFPSTLRSEQLAPYIATMSAEQQEALEVEIAQKRMRLRLQKERLATNASVAV